MDNGSLFIDTFFKPELIVRYLPDILKGMLVTVEIAMLVVVAGISLGLALALVRSLRWRIVNVAIIVFVDVARALPPLVLVLIVYFGFRTYWLGGPNETTSYLSPLPKDHYIF